MWSDFRNMIGAYIILLGAKIMTAHGLHDMMVQVKEELQ